jgi:hypothetical protein
VPFFFGTGVKDVTKSKEEIMTRKKGGIFLFTDDEICDIRSRYPKETGAKLAIEYDTTAATISYIVNYKTYRDVVCK